MMRICITAGPSAQRLLKSWRRAAGSRLRAHYQQYKLTSCSIADTADDAKNQCACSVCRWASQSSLYISTASTCKAQVCTPVTASTDALWGTLKRLPGLCRVSKWLLSRSALFQYYIEAIFGLGIDTTVMLNKLILTASEAVSAGTRGRPAK